MHNRRRPKGSRARMTPMPDPHAPRPIAFPRLLDDAEALLRRARHEPAATANELAEAMDAIELRLEQEPALATRHAARIDRIRAAHALQLRALPEHALDGLYDDIRRTLTGETAWLRAGMSESFLDAPRSLVMWRRVAVAACLLLAVGAGWQLRGAPLEGPQGQELRTMDMLDIPSGLSRGRWAPSAAEPVSFDQDGLRGAVPVSRPGRSERGLYVFRADGAPEDAPRMLDRIQIFPIPGREFDAEEQN